ncbi:tail fiber domain-containing protein [Pantoea sp. Eser]|nr:tail fiber domain-containing protein [Pantoea sp. Eser]
MDSTQVGNVTLSSTSDKGLNKDINYRDDATKALEEVLQWRPADFKMKARGIIPETADQLGFIANDLVKVSPECVGGKRLPEDYDIEADPNNSDAYFLNQVPMIAKLAQALQAQHKIISEQSEIINAMGVSLKDLDGLDG